MEVGGWVGPGLSECVFGKSSQNTPKPVLIFWSSIPITMCILSVYTLLKVVGYYDLSVLSMSVMGFQKKFGWGVGGFWSELYPIFLDFWNFVCAAPHLCFLMLLVSLSHRKEVLLHSDSA